jgi:hypothetical protein
MPVAANPKQRDPNTPLPPAVRRAAEAAERAQLELTGKPPAEPPQQPAQGAQEPLPAPTHPTPPPEPPKAAEGAPEAPQAPSQPEPSKPSEPEANDESWKQKYESQLGRARQLQKDVAALTTRIDEMQQLLATVQAAPPPAEGQPFQAKELLTPEEKQEWAEALPIMEKRFRELYEPREHELQSKISNLEAQLQHQDKRATVSAQASMFQRLDNHPVLGLATDQSWRVLNNDDSFIEWLKYLDAYSGRKRHELLNEAVNSNDAGRVAAIFEGFLKETGQYPAAPQRAAQTNGAGSPPPTGLEQFAAPGPARTAPAAPGAPVDAEIITSGDITRFFADKSAGRWKGREKEADAYERRIFAAQKAGRIRPGPPQP